MMKCVWRLFFALFSAFTVSCSTFVPLERAEHESADSAFLRYVRSEGIPCTKNNKVDILNGAQIKFDSLLDDIRKAKHHVHLEYFNFRNDSINNVLLTLLAEKAKEGVKVRAIFDAFGNISNDSPLKKKDLQKIRSTGIEIVKFDPMCFPWINHAFSRDHRKLVIIDGETAYIGGINVADYYLRGIDGVGEWRDIHSRVTGEAVSELQNIFLKMWERESGERVEGKEYYPELKQQGGSLIAVVDRWPHKTPERMRHAYANAIHAAKDSIVLVTPYLLPTPIITKALKSAIDRGVKVVILLSEKSDVGWVPDGVWLEGYKLMKHGADVYMYTGGFNHSKVMCIDGKFCTIGSANLNSRSLMYDYETNLFVLDDEDTEELYRYIAQDLKQSYKLTKEIYKKRSLWRRISGWLITIFKPFT